MPAKAKPWPVNAWYVAARSDEIADKPLGRQICGERVAMFRRANGSVAAVEDYCPHRGAPMSLGKVEGDTLVCPYHGLAMDGQGRACSMPKQRMGAFPKTRVFPVVERYGFIWLWPGDATLADPAAIPAFEWANRPGFAYGGGLYHVKADYRLMIDNLMDLTHETYVHSTSIGQKEIDEAPVATRVTDDEAIAERIMDNVASPPFWRMAQRANGQDDQAPVDRWQVCRFSLPSHVMIEVGVARAGTGGRHAPDETRTSAVVVDFITPETETSHWYFWGMARQFKTDDAELTATICEGQGAIFAEDLELLERQQVNLQAWPDRRLMKLDIDAGGVYARRMIARAIAAEQNSGALGGHHDDVRPAA
ncbi:MAG: aromatic ring-hydroxylating dioxygenase subunit alpha [Beijerinckiaceae bacterium]